MPAGRAYKPGDTYTLDGTEFVVGDDYEWHVNTSLAGQAAQGVMIDAPVGILGLGTMAANLATRLFQPGTPPAFSPTALEKPQRFYEGMARRLGVNVAQPQDRSQRFARALSQVPGQIGVGIAAGGTSVAAEAAGATAATLATQTAQELGGGTAASGAVGVAADLLARRRPARTVSLVRDIASDVRNAPMINAWKLISPLDLADEGAASLMKQVDAAHTSRRAAMESAYARVGKSQFPVGADHLRRAADAMLAEAGDVSSPRLARNVYVQIRRLLRDGKGTVTLDRLRALQKDANALLDTADPARTGLAQQQGQVRSLLIPAIQATYDDMVKMGEAAAQQIHGNKGAIYTRQQVDALRRANKAAAEYYKVFDKRSAVTKEMVDGIAGGQTLDPQKALRKVFSDPKKSVENARAIMTIVGANPRNEAVMRRAFVESVVSPELANFSAAEALRQLAKMKPAAVEILGKKGYEHFRKLLVDVNSQQASGITPSAGRHVARASGAAIGALSGVMSPFTGGLVGAAVGDVSARTWQYIEGHFGKAAARHLAVNAVYDPSVAALLRANPRRLGSEQLERAMRTALIRSGYRFTTGEQRQPLLPRDFIPATSR